MFGPVSLSSCVIDQRCFLCDFFLPLFLQQGRHFGIWYSATSYVALMSQFFILLCIPFIPTVACADASVLGGLYLALFYMWLVLLRYVSH
jgi:hypothetical protein